MHKKLQFNVWSHKSLLFVYKGSVVRQSSTFCVDAFQGISELHVMEKIFYIFKKNFYSSLGFPIIRSV